MKEFGGPAEQGAGSHQDPTDCVQVQPGECPVHGERQDCAEREEKNAYTNTHDMGMPGLGDPHTPSHANSVTACPSGCPVVGCRCAATRRPVRRSTPPGAAAPDGPPSPTASADDDGLLHVGLELFAARPTIDLMKSACVTAAWR